MQTERASPEAATVVDSPMTTAAKRGLNGRWVHLPEVGEPPRWACAASTMYFAPGMLKQNVPPGSLAVGFSVIPLNPGEMQVCDGHSGTTALACLTLRRKDDNGGGGDGGGPCPFSVSLLFTPSTPAVTVDASPRLAVRVLLRLSVNGGAFQSVVPKAGVASLQMPADKDIMFSIRGHKDSAPVCAIADVAFYRHASAQLPAMSPDAYAACVPDAYYPLDEAYGSRFHETACPERRCAGAPCACACARPHCTEVVRWWSASAGLEPSTRLPSLRVRKLFGYGKGLSYLRDPRYHDVRLVPEWEPEAEPVRAHRLVLAHHSDYLRALFDGGESRMFAPPATAGPDADAVVVPACDARTLRAALEVFYGMRYWTDNFDDDALFGRWGVVRAGTSHAQRPRFGEPQYEAMVTDLVALAHLADAVGAPHLLDVCIDGLFDYRTTRSPERMAVLLRALAGRGGTLASLRYRCVVWLAFRHPLLLDGPHAAWSQMDAADRDEIARKAKDVERAYAAPRADAATCADDASKDDGDGDGRATKRIRTETTTTASTTTTITINTIT